MVKDYKYYKNLPELDEAKIESLIRPSNEVDDFIIIFFFSFISLVRVISHGHPPFLIFLFSLLLYPAAAAYASSREYPFAVSSSLIFCT